MSRTLLSGRSDGEIDVDAGKFRSLPVILPASEDPLTALGAPDTNEITTTQWAEGRRGDERL